MIDMFSSDFLKKDQKQLNDELKIYQKSVKKLKKLARGAGGKDSLPIRRYLSSRLIDMGIIYEFIGKGNRAINNYWDATLLLRDFAEKKGTYQDRYNLARAEFYSARIADQEVNDMILAMEQYEKSLKLFRQLARESDSPSAWRDLSINLYYLGLALLKLNKPDKALKIAEESFKTAKKLLTETETFEARYCLALSRSLMGKVLEKQKRQDEALEIYRESVKIYKKLLDEVDNRIIKSAYSNDLERICFILGHKDQYDEALKYYPEVIKINRQIANETNHVPDWFVLSLNLLNYGDILLEVEKISEAGEVIEEANSILERLPSNEIRKFKNSDRVKEYYGKST